MSTNCSSSPSETSLLFSLPTELREYIWSLYFKPADRLVRRAHSNAQVFLGGVYHFDMALLRVNKQVQYEGTSVWQRENVFVKVTTPWSDAVRHIFCERGTGDDCLCRRKGRAIPGRTCPGVDYGANG